MSKPVAWLAYAIDASESRALFFSREEAEKMAQECGFEVMALVPQLSMVEDDVSKPREASCSIGAIKEKQGRKSIESEDVESIEIEVEKEILFKIMTLAHESDVTLNKYIEVLLTDYLDELERQEDG